MNFPPELIAATEREAEKIPAAVLESGAQAISLRYRTQSGQGRRLLTEDAEAVSYALSRMPATFAVLSRIFEELTELSPAPFGTLLDVGAGTGACVWAAMEAGICESAVCLERERAMTITGKNLMQGMSWQEKVQWQEADAAGMSTYPAADIVTCSYVMNEMNEDVRSSTLKKLWTAAKHILILAEPGTPEGFRQMRAARNTLTGIGANIWAPCPGNGVCPIAPDDWCAFTQRVERTRIHRQLKGGSAPYEDEKFCYLIAARAPLPKQRRTGARVLRHPRIEPGRITLETCALSGRETRVIRKRDGVLFKRARKSDAGAWFYEGGDSPSEE